MRDLLTGVGAVFFFVLLFYTGYWMDRWLIGGKRIHGRKPSERVNDKPQDPYLVEAEKEVDAILRREE